MVKDIVVVTPYIKTLTNINQSPKDEHKHKHTFQLI